MLFPTRSCYDFLCVHVSLYICILNHKLYSYFSTPLFLPLHSIFFNEGHISFIHITITGGIFSSTCKLITVSSAFLCHHIIYNTKFASTIPKAIHHEVDSLAYGRNCIAHNTIIHSYCQRELSMAQNQKVKG